MTSCSYIAVPDDSDSLRVYFMNYFKAIFVLFFWAKPAFPECMVFHLPPFYVHYIFESMCGDDDISICCYQNLFIKMSTFIMI